MDRMTTRELALHFADDFHDWIDGDDPVAQASTSGNKVYVEFESGATFVITIEELEDE